MPRIKLLSHSGEHIPAAARILDSAAGTSQELSLPIHGLDHPAAATTAGVFIITQAACLTKSRF